MNNKRIYHKILTVLLAALMFAGCSDTLKEEAMDFLSPDNFPKTENDLDAAITSVFAALRDGTTGGNMWGLHAGSDDYTATRGLNKQPWLEFNDFNLSEANSMLEKSWGGLYQTIDRANLVIKLQGNVEMDETVRTQKVAQAHFARALCYFHLVRFWGDVPLLLGEETMAEAALVGKTPAAQIYDQIIIDAEAAEAVLPKTWANQPGRPTVGAAKTLLANIYATMAGWPMNKGQAYYEMAANKAAEVIALNQYDLEDNFADVFSYENKNGKEHIFAIQGNVDKGIYGNKALRGSENKGWKDILADIAFFQSFPEDTRKPVSFRTVFKGGVQWENSKEGHPWVFKFDDVGPVAQSKAKTANNYSVFRYAEVLLLYAECQNMADGAPNATSIGYLNDIRNRASGNDPSILPLIESGISSADFDAAVLQERAWEFAFEHKRWHDLVRRDMVKEANMNHELNDFDPSVITQEDYLFPIPQREVVLNPNLK
ncbi:RagB/SusD family nutrient uptake outer membrane protein [Puteibacter caeruleilacunae]|nr:RagB/SusD family nutrient uptake outer membrane protein [Puteibacter caeruleilacunae]